MTAEVAVALPALTAVLALLLGSVAAGMTQLRLEEAARAGAREVMRGEPRETVQATVQRVAGRDAVLRLASDGSWTTVQVSAGVPGLLEEVIRLELSASAVAAAEPSMRGIEWPPP